MLAMPGPAWELPSHMKQAPLLVGGEMGSLGDSGGGFMCDGGSGAGSGVAKSGGVDWGGGKIGVPGDLRSKMPQEQAPSLYFNLRSYCDSSA